MSRPLMGRPICKYCTRELTPTTSPADTAFTFDHVKSQAEGGWKRVPCCRKCNMLKADLPMDSWFWFIGTFKRWWKTFDTPQQVRERVREEHTRRAYANAAIVKKEAV